MRRPPHVQVTLSNELLQHLRKAACQQHVPLCWLVTGLICDTLEKRGHASQPTDEHAPALATQAER